MYFTALDRRFKKTCLSSDASPAIGGNSPTVQRTSRPFAVALHLGDRLAGERREIHQGGPELLAAEAREGQQLVDQVPHLPHGVLDRREIVAPLFVQARPDVAPEKPRESVDVPERRAKIMRDRVGEGLQLLVQARQLPDAPPELPVQLLDLLFGEPHLRHVPGRRVDPPRLGVGGRVPGASDTSRRRSDTDW